MDLAHFCDAHLFSANTYKTHTNLQETSQSTHIRILKRNVQKMAVLLISRFKLWRRGREFRQIFMLFWRDARELLDSEM